MRSNAPRLLARTCTLRRLAEQERSDAGWLSTTEKVQKVIRWKITREEFESGGPIDIFDELSGVRETGLRFSPGAKTARGEQSGASITFVVETAAERFARTGEADEGSRPVRLDLKKGLSQAGGSGASLPDALTVMDQVRRYRQLEEAELNLSLIKNFETQHGLKHPRKLLENQIASAMEKAGSFFANGHSGMAAQLRRLDITPEECIRGFAGKQVDAPDGGVVIVDQQHGAQNGDLAMFERGPGSGVSEWRRVEYETAAEIQRCLRENGQKDTELQLLIVEFRVPPLSAGSAGRRELGLPTLMAKLQTTQQHYENERTQAAVQYKHAAEKKDAKVSAANARADKLSEELQISKENVVKLEAENARLQDNETTLRVALTAEETAKATHAAEIKKLQAKIRSLETPPDDESHCGRCPKKFYTSFGNSHCRACGKTLCSGCSGKAKKKTLRVEELDPRVRSGTHPHIVTPEIEPRNNCTVERVTVCSTCDHRIDGQRTQMAKPHILAGVSPSTQLIGVGAVTTSRHCGFYTRVAASIRVPVYQSCREVQHPLMGRWRWCCCGNSHVAFHLCRGY
jgi:hypothetical protein